MALSAGTRLGPYEILAPLGAGGMGEVYRARDTRLDRTVAIKILPAHLSTSADLRHRFEREARVISGLNHPHICALYDVGFQDGIAFLVMEYLEGETLADRLRKGPLSLEQMLRYGVAIADALDRAHKKGIVHRDLKPGNVMITKAGAKLLDFGLAKFRDDGVGSAGDVSTRSTGTSPLTQEGAILGTVQYMAPEQLEGKEADARADIWALGLTLYEMATGKAAFEGKSHATLIGAILKDEPTPISSLRPATPPTLDRLVQTCLSKDPDDRWQSAHDVVTELRWTGDAAAPASTGVVRARRRVPWIVAGAIGLLWLVTLIPAAVHWRERSPEVQPVRFAIAPPDKATFYPFDIPAVSPDGTRILFAAVQNDRRRIWIRSLDALAAQALPGTEDGFDPFWSPDGRSVGFFAQGRLKRIDLPGGPARTLCATTQATAGGTWSQRGEIVFGGLTGPLFKVSAAGGEPSVVTTLNTARQETQHHWPSFLPDGRHFLYLARSAQQQKNAVFVGSVESTEGRAILSADSSAVYARPDHLLYVREGTLMGQAFDARTLSLTGEAFRVAEPIPPTGQSAGRAFSVSSNGVLVYRTGGDSVSSRLVWFDRTGQRLGVLGDSGDYSNPALSPDDKQLAVGRRDPSTLMRDIWIFQLEHGTMSRFTFDPADDLNPVFSPDGARILFTSDRKGSRDLFWKASNGVGDDELLLESQYPKSADDWSADGRFLVYDSGGSGEARGLWIVPLTGDRSPMPLMIRPFTYSHGRIAPNGRWIAYSGNDSGRLEVYVQEFPKPGGKWQVSSGGGIEPMWRRDGRELFYVADRKLMAVEVATDGAAFQTGVPRAMFETDVDQRILRNHYVVSADGQRFLFIVPAVQSPVSPITVVVNWR